MALAARPSGSERIARWRAIAIIWAIISLGGVCWSLATLHIDPEITAQASRTNLRNLLPFWLVSASTWAALTLLLFTLLEARSAAGPGDALPLPRNPGSTFSHSQESENIVGRARGGWAGRIAPLILILIVAVAARMIVIATHEPALSGDVWRYIYDGRNLANGVNPYRPSPDESERGGERWPGERAIAQRITDDERYTMYLPVAQVAFMIAGRMCGALQDPSDASANARIFRAVFATLDIFVIILLLGALVYARRSAWWAALYAWHPLPVTEISGSGHHDVLGIAFVLLAVITARAPILRGWGWMISTALAALVKPVAIIVAGYVLRDRPLRHWIKAAVIAIVVLITLCAPLLLTYRGEPLDHFLGAVGHISLEEAHFGSIYEALHWSFDQIAPAWGEDAQQQFARAICFALVLIIAGVIWFRVRDLWKASRMIFFAMVLLSPAVHPWYLLWALVFVPMRPSAAVWVASLTLMWGYAAWGSHVLGGVVRGDAPVTLTIISYVPIYATLIVTTVQYKRNRG